MRVLAVRVLAVCVVVVRVVPVVLVLVLRVAHAYELATWRATGAIRPSRGHEQGESGKHW
jgi:hypothetical protein